MKGLTRTEGSEREDMMVDCKVTGPPKVGEKSPKVRGPFEKGNCRFVLFVQKGHTSIKKDHCHFEENSKTSQSGRSYEDRGV